AGGGIVGSRVSPGVARVQQLAVDTLDGLGHVEVDDRHVLGLGADQGAGLDGGDDGPGGGDAEAGAHAVTTTGPAGVDQVDLAAEGIDALDQQFGVYAGRAREERRAEAGGEGRLDAAARPHLGGADQCSVTGQEVVGRLLVVQDGHRGQYTGQVAGQEDDGVRLTSQVRLDTLFDMLQRVG